MNKSALDYAIIAAETIMNKFSVEDLPPANHFHYHQGVFLAGVERLYNLTNDEKYKNYIKAWVDIYIDENGNCKTCNLDMFDDIQPGILLFNLYDTTKDERYKIMLDTLYKNIEMWPTNAKGGVWHKKFLKNQMWLDSMYMMGVFSSMYAKRFNKSYMFDKIYTQAKLMYTYMKNPKTGLLYHMWDDSKEESIVNNKTGIIEVSWGRALSWYVVALSEILEQLPKKHYLRQKFIDIEIELLNSIIKYQDKISGQWYQVVDRINDTQNFTESSCTALFTYAIAKCINLGILDKSYCEYALKGYKGTLDKIEIKNNEFVMKDICVGTGFGNGKLDYYYSRPTRENDLHGVGAFLLMTTEIYKMEK